MLPGFKPEDVRDEILVDENERLPSPLAELADEKAADAAVTPGWVKQLQAKKLAQYFPESLDSDTVLSPDSLTALLADATRLHEYFESLNPSANSSKFIETQLRPYIMSMSVKRLLTPLPSAGARVPLRHWTVEMLVVSQQLEALTKTPRFFRNAMKLVTGPHLRGASKVAITLAIASASFYGARLAGFDDMLSGFVLGTLVMAFRAGPVAELMKASTSWFLTPATEYIKVLNARYTARLEQRINGFFDSIRPHSDTELEEMRNQQPRIANVDQDGMSFANMTPDDQRANWDKNLRVWVAVAKRYGQLLRDTHHAGRFLMMISWSDEQNATQMVETMDSKLVSLTTQAEVLLAPYKTALIARGKGSLAEQLEITFDQFQEACSESWLTLSADDDGRDTLKMRIETLMARMQEIGVSGRDMKKLIEIQADRAKATSTLVTALAVNEMRMFATAESNRNLQDEARESQRAVRRGFQLQTYVDRYLPLVQAKQRDMKYQNTGSHQVAVRSCEDELALDQREGWQ